MPSSIHAAVLDLTSIKIKQWKIELNVKGTWSRRGFPPRHVWHVNQIYNFLHSLQRSADLVHYFLVQAFLPLCTTDKMGFWLPSPYLNCVSVSDHTSTHHLNYTICILMNEHFVQKYCLLFSDILKYCKNWALHVLIPLHLQEEILWQIHYGKCLISLKWIQTSVTRHVQIIKYVDLITEQD